MYSSPIDKGLSDQCDLKSSDSSIDFMVHPRTQEDVVLIDNIKTLSHDFSTSLSNDDFHQVPECDEIPMLNNELNCYHRPASVFHIEVGNDDQDKDSKCVGIETDREFNLESTTHLVHPYFGGGGKGGKNEKNASQGQVPSRYESDKTSRTIHSPNRPRGNIFYEDANVGGFYLNAENLQKVPVNEDDQLPCLIPNLNSEMEVRSTSFQIGEDSIIDNGKENHVSMTIEDHRIPSVFHVDISEIKPAEENERQGLKRKFDEMEGKLTKLHCQKSQISKKHSEDDDTLFENKWRKIRQKMTAEQRKIWKKFETETELKLQCEEFGISYIAPKADETKKEQRNRRRNMRGKLTKNKCDILKKQLSRPVKSSTTTRIITKEKCRILKQLQEEKSIRVEKKEKGEALKGLCEKWGIEFLKASKNENTNDRHVRISSLKEKICKAEKMARLLVPNFHAIEQKLKEHCQKWGVGYESPAPNEEIHETATRRRRVRKKIKTLKLEQIKTVTFAVRDVMSDMIDDVCRRERGTEGPTEEDSHILHSNPAVIEAATKFEHGEALHTIKTCQVCLETQPVFHLTEPDGAVSFKPWKTTKNGLCKRCQTESYKNKKKAQAAKFSGCYSKAEHMGPERDLIRHNNMHFLPVPPYLKNLTTIEMTLISKIAVIMNVHVLRYGMLASKGHCVSLPQEMKIATNLPLLPEEVGIIILKRRNSKTNAVKEYTVKREVVEDALKGLCYGYPYGGLPHPCDGLVFYDGPDHINMKLKGRYFQYAPNQYYFDVNIIERRLIQLPSSREQFPLREVQLGDYEEDDKGPAEEQFTLNEDDLHRDNNYTSSGVTCPLPPKDIQKELQLTLDRLVGQSGVGDAIFENNGTHYTANWEYVSGSPIKELQTEGFFTMAFSTIFVNGSCDITIPKLKNIDFDEFVKHIYFNVDNRVSEHPFLKFVLHNLRERKKALKQGSFVVAQQLADAHLSIEDLKKQLEDENETVPRKIINIASNLPNTHPFWRERQRELESIMYYRKMVFGDVPSYFDTNSLAEYHCVPLLDLLAKYHAVVSDEDVEHVKERITSDSSFRRAIVLKNLHIVTSYFDKRIINYYATVMRAITQFDDAWWRYEFAKSRGAIHSHGVFFSTKHYEMMKRNENEEDRAEYLRKWLQTPELNSNGIYSPEFCSMHPGGGSTYYDENNEVIWAPDKTKWAAPEGTQMPPDENPLSVSISDVLTEGHDLKKHHIDLVNRVGLHRCSNGYCLKTKGKGAEKVKYCRFHFGEQDSNTKEMSGKQPHPFHAEITEGDNPRYEGPRDHPRMVMHIKAKLLTWLANNDTQAVIHDNLTALRKYIAGYACKGGATTQDLLLVYQKLIDTCDKNTALRTVAQRLLNKLIGMIDLSGAAADYLNIGGSLHHSTRRIRRAGMSGYRVLAPGKDGNATRENLVDKFLSPERRKALPNISLYEYAKRCNCAKTNCCNKDHAPCFTGLPQYTNWPVSEGYAQRELMLHTKADWFTIDDLKRPFETFSEAFSAFLDSADCPSIVRLIMEEARERFEKRNGSTRTVPARDLENEIDEENDLATPSSTNQELAIGAEMMRELADDSEIDPFNLPGIPYLNDGGEDFDWYQYGIDSLGTLPPPNYKEWVSRASEIVASQNNSCQTNNLKVNLLIANPLQRVIIAINLIQLLQMKTGNASPNEPPLRLMVQGTAGVGKTFVIKALTYLSRRIFGPKAAMNLAPTGAAAVLLPNGRTVHSTTNIPREGRIPKDASLSDYPQSNDSLTNLRTLVGYDEESQESELVCLNLDERSQWSKRVLAWCDQRFKEALENSNETFGGVPIVNFFGDVGQMGPIGDGCDLNDPVDPEQLSKFLKSTESRAGYAIYRSFRKVVILTQTMRQSPDEINFLNLLLRIRNGTVTQEDWLDINQRWEGNLTCDEKTRFNHERVITLMETWEEVNFENYLKLAEKNVPVAKITSDGKGAHHRKTIKQLGQIPPVSFVAVGSTVMLTKNQKNLTSYGLNNGAMGVVKAILYEKNVAPPAFPGAVVVDFPAYNGPAWIPDAPTWVPIPVDIGRCDSNCCSRGGMPLIPGYAIPIAKSQGMSVGANHPATELRVKLRPTTKMEELNLGTTYTALSRVDKNKNWVMVDKVPQERIMYINNHPRMKSRMQEEERLKNMSDKTVGEYTEYQDPAKFIALLRQFDEICNDGSSDSTCASNSSECTCMACRGC